MKSSLGWTLLGVGVWFVFLVLIGLANGLLLDLALVIALMVFIAGICAKMTEGDRLLEHQRLIDFWSKFARATGLVLSRGNAPRLFRYTQEPSVNGSYRGHQILATSMTRGTTYGSLERCTYVSLKIQNATGCQLVIRSRHILERFFGIDNTNSGNTDFDQRIRVDGYPDSFVRKALQRIVRFPHFLIGPGTHTPTIQLQGSQLFYLIPEDLAEIEDLVSILNLLCDLAELAEKEPAEMVVAQLNLLHRNNFLKKRSLRGIKEVQMKTKDIHNT